MTIRVTVGSASAGSLLGLQAASSRLAELQQRLASGDQIGKPSDDPAGAVRAMELRGDLQRNAQFARASADATGWLSIADSTYGQITDLVQKARTLTVQALNAGASTGQSANAIADQIDSIRTAILKLSNTTYNDRPIFGGTTMGDKAFTESAGVVGYQGDDGVVRRTIGDANTIQINQTGPEAFGRPDPTAPLGQGNQGIFALLDNISANLRTDGTAGGTGANQLVDPLGDLSDAINKLTSARADSGAALARVEAAQATQAGDKLSLKTNLSQIEDIDLAETIVQVSTARVVYQAALQSTANIRQLSLMDFLR